MTEEDEATIGLEEGQEAERRLLTLLAKSHLEGTVYTTDVIHFTSLVTISPELQARYALDRVDWLKLRQMVRRDIRSFLEVVEEEGTRGSGKEVKEERLAHRLWAYSKLYAVMLEARPGHSISNWVDDPYTMTDWVVKKLKGWEAQSGGYFQEGELNDGGGSVDRGGQSEESVWLSTAERVLDIPSENIPEMLRRAFALAAALLWGEG